MITRRLVHQMFSIALYCGSGSGKVCALCRGHNEVEEMLK